MPNELTAERIVTAIEFLEDCVEGAIKARGNGINQEGFNEVHTALAALRAEQERMNPAPLTLDELHAALKKPNDWLWGEDIEGNGECSGWYKCEHMSRVSNIAYYGETWLVYRTKPEGSDT